MRHRTVTVLTGAQRSGKTNFATKLGEAANRRGQTLIGFNKGMVNDFKDYQIVELPDQQETADYIYNNQGRNAFKAFNRSPKMMYFDINGVYYEWKRFNSVLGGKKIAFYLPDNTNFFFKNMFLYVSNAFFIGDDFRAVTRNGVSANLGMFLNRSNHTGIRSTSKKVASGCDIVLIYHNIDLIPAEVMHYATHFVMYHSNTTPRCNNFDNDDVKKAVLESDKLLKEGKKKNPDNFFDCYQIPLKGVNQFKKILIKGENLK